jgi:hypothetical protein
MPTGFWFLGDPSSHQPPAALGEFRVAGLQPVCAGFGSMIHAPAIIALQVNGRLP